MRRASFVIIRSQRCVLTIVNYSNFIFLYNVRHIQGRPQVSLRCYLFFVVCLARGSVRRSFFHVSGEIDYLKLLY